MKLISLITIGLLTASGWGKEDSIPKKNADTTLLHSASTHNFVESVLDKYAIDEGRALHPKIPSESKSKPKESNMAFYLSCMSYSMFALIQGMLLMWWEATYKRKKILMFCLETGKPPSATSTRPSFPTRCCLRIAPAPRKEFKSLEKEIFLYDFKAFYFYMAYYVMGLLQPEKKEISQSDQKSKGKSQSLQEEEIPCFIITGVPSLRFSNELQTLVVNALSNKSKNQQSHWLMALHQLAYQVKALDPYVYCQTNLAKIYIKKRLSFFEELWQNYQGQDYENYTSYLTEFYLSPFSSLAEHV